MRENKKEVDFFAVVDDTFIIYDTKLVPLELHAEAYGESWVQYMIQVFGSVEEL